MGAEQYGFLNLFNPEYTSTSGNWIVNCILLVMIAVLVHLFIWMFSRAFKIEEIERYAKSEMFQAFATGLLIIMIVGLVFEVDKYVGTQFQDQKFQATCEGEAMEVTDHPIIFDLIRCQLSEKAKILSNLQEDITDNAYDAFVKYSIMISLVGIPIYQGQWVDSYFSEVENYRILNQVTTDLLVGLNGIILLVDFIQKSMLTLYLPAGLLLRSFHFTRSLGAFLIAVALSFYYVFPFVWLITDPTMEKTTIVKAPKSDYNQCFPTFTGVASALTGDAFASAARVSSSREAAKVVGQFYISMLAHPFIVLAITLIFLRFIMTLLGGEAFEVMRILARSI